MKPEQQSLMREDLDEALCVICGEAALKSSMDWLSNALGEQGWCCQECQVASENGEDR